MDQNEYFSRQNFAAALSKAATAGATDEASAQVIREARENLARETARAVMDADELFQVFGVKDLDELAAVAPILESLGCPKFPRAVTLDARRQPIPTTRLMRFDYDRWIERFDRMARQMGYEKPVSTRSARKAVVAGVATLVGLFFR
jgi:hypothetical protein